MTLPDLQSKTVLLGVTGSISAYKACEIARLFVKAGADVHIVMTPSAERFVGSLTFEALTRNPVLTERSESWSGTLNHIDTGKKADIFIIAPATANTLNKLSKGIADNILLQTALAFDKTMIVAPAANTRMLANHYTQGSIKMLRVNDIEVVDPQSKRLACNEEGMGALAEAEEIFWRGARALLRDDFWSQRRVVVTGGGTREKIDDIRYLSNYSSGKMGKALATALFLRGADVCYITTKETDNLPSEVYTINVESAEEMMEFTVDAVRVAKKGIVTKASMNTPEAPQVVRKTPYLFMAAAVADYRPKFPQKGKLKKETLDEEWCLELVQTSDILSSLNKEGLKTVAFKAETDAEKGEVNAYKLLETKNVDAVCYNHIADSKSFGSDIHSVVFITKEGRRIALSPTDKLSLSLHILDEARRLERE